MITKDEIEERAAALELHRSNVQRDYVFGWLIAGVFEESQLGSAIALKGGNAFRKGYFPETRFSDDLDFTTAQGLNSDLVIAEFNKVCSFAQERSGVQFDIDRNYVVDEQVIDRDRRVYKLRLYFKDFAGGAEHITLKIRVDVTEYDRLYLPVQERQLIHQYSDANELSSVIRCVKLEELLADKLKCLLQRRYAYDLFDLVYAVFVNQELAVDKSEIVRVFLKKSIFEPSPAAAKRLLLSLPLDLVKGFWGKVVCPAACRIPFERAVAYSLRAWRPSSPRSVASIAPWPSIQLSFANPFSRPAASDAFSGSPITAPHVWLSPIRWPTKDARVMAWLKSISTLTIKPEVGAAGRESRPSFITRLNGSN